MTEVDFLGVYDWVKNNRKRVQVCELKRVGAKCYV
jgi:hypothetical protein